MGYAKWIGLPENKFSYTNNCFDKLMIERANLVNFFYQFTNNQQQDIAEQRSKFVLE